MNDANGRPSDTEREWLVLGGAQGGTVLATAIAQDAAQTAFAASEVGVYRARLEESRRDWQRLGDLPGSVTALAISPTFAQDHTLLIGTTTGPMVSFDGGESFYLSTLPRPSTRVATLALSPNFGQDGFAFAGTLEDGVLVSQDHGRSWAAWNFGLFELQVVALALSPNFAQDETVLMSTTSGLYFSYNSGRAWRELAFPMEQHPIVSLAFSPNYAHNGFVLAGTESAGLYGAKDLLLQSNAASGALWQSIEIPNASCINALVFSADSMQLFAATEQGILVSKDFAGWETVLNVSGALTLALAEHVGIAGVGFEGEPEITGLTVAIVPTVEETA